MNWTLLFLLLVLAVTLIETTEHINARKVTLNNTFYVMNTFILALSSSSELNASNAACKVSDVTPWSKPPTKTLQLVGEATNIFHKAMSFSFDK